MPSAQFACRKGLGCTGARLAISHHLQKSLDAGMESYIVLLDYSAAFDTVSHSGLLFKLKSIGVGGSVVSICTEFHSDRRQRVVVDGAAGKWIPIISVCCYYYLKRLAMQGREREIDTLSVGRAQPHTTNL